MSRSRILDPAKSYTFNQYAQLAFNTVDIWAELGVTLTDKAFPNPNKAPIDATNLQQELQENLALVSLSGVLVSL